MRDHLRWRASPIHNARGWPPEDIRAAVAEMRETGLAVEYEELPHDISYEEFRWQPAVKCRQVDSEKVRTGLELRGL